MLNSFCSIAQAPYPQLYFDTNACSSAIIIHHAVFRPFDVVELTRLGRPEEEEPCGEAEEEHENDECDDCPEHVDQPFLTGSLVKDGLNLDAFVRNPETTFSVIPVKTGIQSF
jgi:hypothetical protein